MRIPVGWIQALGGVVVGLAAGLALGLQLARPAAPPAGPAPGPAAASTGATANGREALEAEIAWLRAALEAREAPNQAAGDALPDEPEGAAEDAEAAQAPVAFDAEALAGAGYAAAEIERLRQRWDAFELERLYLMDQARREGWLGSGRFQRENRQLFTDLRSSLGDDDFDAALYAAGHNNRVAVFDVLSGSAAEQAGLQPGDRILRYDGQRIFDMRSLVRATAEGEAGRSVEVRFERGGEERRAFLPAGPIGVRLRPERGSPDTLR